MYCVQCEQTMRTPMGNGCSYSQGMCGKTAETSDLQDLLIATLQSLSAWAIQARDLAIIDNEIDGILVVFPVLLFDVGLHLQGERFLFLNSLIICT